MNNLQAAIIATGLVKVYKGEPSWKELDTLGTVEIEAGEGEVVQGTYGPQLKVLFDDGSIGFIALGKGVSETADVYRICTMVCFNAYEKNGVQVNVGDKMIRALAV